VHLHRIARGASLTEARTQHPPQLSNINISPTLTTTLNHTIPIANMTQANLLTPPPSIPPPTALALSQKAPLILSTTPTSSLPWPLSLLFSRETPETWTIHENLFFASLRTDDESSALSILQRLEARFGEHNERIVTLRGIYNEATSKSDADLEKVFEAYEQILRTDPTNMSIRKRRVAVLKALGRTNDAVTAVTVLLQNSPTDSEAWAEASELYAGMADWGKAIFCAEEVLLITPNAWSVRCHHHCEMVGFGGIY
jgi:tetratricopeptide (TPR) repeat protein